MAVNLESSPPPPESEFHSNEESDIWTDKGDPLEHIAKQIVKIYTREGGLEEIGTDFNLSVARPKAKVTILLVGDDDLAKRKFLNHYFREPRSEAFISRKYDKLNHIYVTEGSRRTLIIGDSILDYCSHLAILRDNPQWSKFWTTEVTSKPDQSMVSFILFPGRGNSNQVEGNLDRAPPTLERALDGLVLKADLVLIFFDPSGEIAPWTTLEPFQKFWDEQHEKFHLILADLDHGYETPTETVLSQVVRSLWAQPYVLRTGVIPPIHCPDLTYAFDDDQLGAMIRNVRKKSVKDSLAQLEQDANSLSTCLSTRLVTSFKRKISLGLGQIGISLIGAILIMEVLKMAKWWTRVDDKQTEAQGAFSSFSRDYYEYCLLVGLTIALAVLMNGFWFIICAKCFTTEDSRGLHETQLRFLARVIRKKEKMLSFVESLERVGQP